MKKLFRNGTLIFLTTIMGLHGCAPAPIPIPSTLTSTPRPTNTFTPTTTLTPTSTIIPPTFTATIEPKPEIKPIFTQEVSTKYLGVQINTKIITDESFQIHSNPSIIKVTIADATAAQFIARTIFMTWWVKGNVEHKDKPTEKDFNSFMDSWSAAQNGKGSWEDIQFRIFANDMATQEYDQEIVTIWPMFTKNTLVTPEVHAISEINLVYTIGEYSTNRTILDDDFGVGLGTNLDGTALNLYVIPISTLSGKNANPVPRSNHNLAGITAAISWYLINNPGRANWTVNPRVDKQLYNLLLQGFKAYTSKGAQNW